MKLRIVIRRHVLLEFAGAAVISSEIIGTISAGIQGTGSRRRASFFRATRRCSIACWGVQRVLSRRGRPEQTRGGPSLKVWPISRRRWATSSSSSDMATSDGARYPYEIQ
jgi:hypothetical protein